MASIDLNKINRNKVKQINTTDSAFSSVKQLLTKDFSFGNKALKDRLKQSFYADLGMLLTSGIDIKTSFELICNETTKQNIKTIFEEIKEKIINGESLSIALEKSEQFSPYEFYSIKIGEESGKLIDVLTDLTDYYNRKIEQRRKIINAFSYPLIVMFTAFGAIFFMLNFIVPMFKDVFKRFNSDLPTLTKFVIQLSVAFSKYTIPLLFIVTTIGVIMFVSREKPWYRSLMASFLLKIPVIGIIIRKVYLARFCLSMQLLIGARTPLIQAIRLMKKMIGFYPMEISLEIIEKDIMNGISLNESLSNFEIYDRRMISLIKVAEEVNQLDVIFGKLKDQYSKDVEYQTGLISSILEPIMIIFIGIFVAMILIAMYLPMFQMSTSIGY